MLENKTMGRPKAKPFDEIGFRKLYAKVVELTEQTLDDLDEGWDEKKKANDNEDIIVDNETPTFEALITAIYGEEYWDYFNSKL